MTTGEKIYRKIQGIQGHAVISDRIEVMTDEDAIKYAERQLELVYQFYCELYEVMNQLKKQKRKK